MKRLNPFLSFILQPVKIVRDNKMFKKKKKKNSAPLLEFFIYIYVTLTCVKDILILDKV